MMLALGEKTFQRWSEQTKHYNWVVMLCARPPELRNSRALQTEVMVYCAFVFKMEIWWGSRLQLKGNSFSRGDIIAGICRAWRILVVRKGDKCKKVSERTEWPCSNQFSNSIFATNNPLRVNIHVCWMIDEASDEDRWSLMNFTVVRWTISALKGLVWWTLITWVISHNNLLAELKLHHE